jgi:hypothetical protein
MPSVKTVKAQGKKEARKGDFTQIILHLQSLSFQLLKVAKS